MDLQLIGNAYGAAEYAGAYVSKAEPDTLRFKRVIAKAVQRCDPNLSYQSVLKRVANAMLSVREVGAPEAIYILLRDRPMHSKSRTIVKVKILRHNLRYYRVEPQGLEEVAALAEPRTREDIRIEAIERAYMNRPDSELFNDMTLASFVEGFDTVDHIDASSSSDDVWERIDGEGWIKRRKKSVVVQKSPWMRPNTENPDFCFSEIFLYAPWRSLAELPATDDECIERFYMEQEGHLDSELREESYAKIARQHTLDLLRAARATSGLSTLPSSEYVFVSRPETFDPLHAEHLDASALNNGSSSEEVSWRPRHEYVPEVIEKARNFVNDCLKPWMKEKTLTQQLGSVFRQPEAMASSYRYPIDDDLSITENAESMAESQWIPFALAMQQSRKRFRCSLENTHCKPLQMVINGEGGSGKSWLIKHIVKDMHNVFGEHAATRRKSKRVLLLAHQGTAAFNIKGETICSALSFASFSRSAFSVPYKSLTESKAGPVKLKNMQQRFRDVHLVIIDEFSMISCGMLHWIDRRMREIWPSHADELFGGRDVYFTGDAAQLDPVVPSSLSTPISKISNEVQRRGREIWSSIDTVCTLTSQNRGKLDPEWFADLSRLRKKTPTAEDIELFNSRCLQTMRAPDWLSTAKHIAFKNADVDIANKEQLHASKSPIVHLTAQHFVQQKRLAAKRDIPSGTVQALLKDAKETANSDHDRVVARKLKLCVGAPVTLIFNMAQRAGLCNGTNGVVYDFLFVAGSELPIVLVQITDTYLGPSLLANIPNIVPIAPKDVSWGKASSDLRVVRRGIPLRLSYAMTVHKVQGLTCVYVVFHSQSIPNIAFTYVALSRIRHRNAIAITHPLSLEKLTASPDKVAEFERESARVSEAVDRTTAAAVTVIQAMKQLALDHNRALSPR